VFDASITSLKRRKNTSFDTSTLSTNKTMVDNSFNIDHLKDRKHLAVKLPAAPRGSKTPEIQVLNI
jgi:hypothetical protein